MFGDILRNLIDEKEITQKQLASNLNIAVSTLGNYVRNNREPDFETLKLIASYFSVSTDYFLDYKPDFVINHMESDLLRVFRSLSDNQKNLYLEQGKLLVKYDKKEKPTSSKLISQAKDNVG